MIIPKQIEAATMSEEKKKSAKNDLFAFYVGRPLSYLLTIPFLYTNISPNAVSLISVIPIFVGFLLMVFGHTQSTFVIAWLCFFLWNLLDGVDGNIARYKKQFSEMGSVYDAMSGYFAMVLSFFAWGAAACHSENLLDSWLTIPHELYIVMGAFSGICVIFPRLVMHKAINSVKDKDKFSDVKDKSEYGPIKLIALNLTSIAGFVQVLMLAAILLHLLDLFTIGYCLLNFLVMVVSLKSVLSK